MKDKTKHQIELYLKNEIFPFRSVKEVIDAVLFFQLASYDEYASLATKIEIVNDIPGLKELSKGMARLHCDFSRHHQLLKKLNIFSAIYEPAFSGVPSFNPDNYWQRRYFLRCFQAYVESYIGKLGFLFRLSLVNDYDYILASLFHKNMKYVFCERRDIFVGEIYAVIRKKLCSKGAVLDERLVKSLARQYIEHRVTLIRIFEDNTLLDQIRNCKRAFKDLSAYDIPKIIQDFSQSRMCNYGVYYRISPEAKLAVKSYLIALVITNVVITVLLQYVIPQVSILSSAFVLGLILTGVLNLAPILISILVNKYYQTKNKESSEAEKKDLVLKLNLRARVHEYFLRLQRSGFDLSDTTKCLEADFIRSSRVSAGEVAPNSGEALVRSGLFSTRSREDSETREACVPVLLCPSR